MLAFGQEGGLEKRDVGDWNVKAKVFNGACCVQGDRGLVVDGEGNTGEAIGGRCVQGTIE